MPKVSVILPVYNNHRTVAGAVRSILDQSFTDFELLVVNDGSNDGTDAVLAAVSDARVRIISDGKNLGLPRRLNQVVAMAEGQYIARMDADDIAFPDRLQKQADYLDAHTDIDVLAMRAIVFDDSKSLLGLMPFAAHHADICRRPWSAFPMPHPTWMVRRSWFDKYHYAIPEIWRAEDQDILLRGHQDSCYACLPDVGLCYRQNIFSFPKVGMARRSLLRAQLSYFLGRGQYAYSTLSLIGFVVKTASDIVHLFKSHGKPYIKSNFCTDFPAGSDKTARDLLNNYGA